MDLRAEFANHVLHLLYDKYDGNIKDKDFLDELHDLYHYFDEFVRNIYEIFEEDIPLFLYHDYLRARKVDDIYCERFEDMTKEEVIIALEKEIHEFYGYDEDES